MKRADLKRRPGAKLSDTTLNALEPEKNTEYRVHDADRVYFRVKPDGNKSWQLRYKDGSGKWKWHGLGGYPEISAAKARELAADASKEIRNGIYPADKKAAQKAAVVATNTKTFRIVVEQWYEYKQSKGLAESRPAITARAALKRVRNCTDGRGSQKRGTNHDE